MTYFTHLECPRCLRSYARDALQTFCLECNSPILAKYDLGSAKTKLDRDKTPPPKKGIWRWKELLPVENLTKIASLGEGDTPLIQIQFEDLQGKSTSTWIKDESENPTASFKARGLSAAVSKANELGLNQLVIPSAGNAGSALAAYSARAGIKSACVMPEDTPKTIINECMHYGAQVILVDGLISDCGKIVETMTSTQEWFSVSTFREPYRVEGKKTIGFEIAEQFGWNLPAMIIYPTGGGTGLVGMWKAFEELDELGWLENKKLPRMVAVQSEGCAPFVKAYKLGWDRCEFWQDAETIANGIRVPISLADSLILEIIRKSGGCAIGVSETAMLEAQKELAEVHGIFTSPEGGATLAAYKQLLLKGEIQPDEQVVLFSTASGVKYW